jgi:hypothetical protein
METLAADLVDLHPEYHELLEAADALTREWTPEQGETNPFLHLSLHLAIEEQLSIDQPPGIRAAFTSCCKAGAATATTLCTTCSNASAKCSGAPSAALPPDGEAYLDCVRRKAG